MSMKARDIVETLKEDNVILAFIYTKNSSSTEFDFAEKRKNDDIQEIYGVYVTSSGGWQQRHK